MKKLLLMIFAMFMAFAVSAQTNNKIIHLKDGKIVRGTILEQKPNEFVKIQTNDGSIFIYKFDEIRSIKRETLEDVEEIKIKKLGLTKGWHGYINVGLGISNNEVATNSDSEDISGTSFAVSGSYGYQFSPYFFLGAGTGFYSIDKAEFIPLYGDVRIYLSKHKGSPFLSCKLGCNINQSKTYFVAPTIGYRFKIGKRNGLNIGLEYIESEPDCEDEKYEDIWKSSSFGINIGIDF